MPKSLSRIALSLKLAISELLRDNARLVVKWRTPIPFGLIFNSSRDSGN
jgi:hypothetical protein